MGNDDGAAALEITLTGPTMRFMVDSGEGQPPPSQLLRASLAHLSASRALQVPETEGMNRLLRCIHCLPSTAWILLLPPAVVAVCGAAAPVSLDGQPVPMWQSFAVKRGQVVKVGATEGEQAGEGCGSYGRAAALRLSSCWPCRHVCRPCVGAQYA